MEAVDTVRLMKFDIYVCRVELTF